VSFQNVCELSKLYIGEKQTLIYQYTLLETIQKISNVNNIALLHFVRSRFKTYLATKNFY